VFVRLLVFYDIVEAVAQSSRLLMLLLPSSLRVLSYGLHYSDRVSLCLIQSLVQRFP